MVSTFFNTFFTFHINSIGYKLLRYNINTHYQCFPIFQKTFPNQTHMIQLISLRPEIYRLDKGDIQNA